ncbi:MFS transporter [Pseudoclavibacter sp. 8L]|uniref:MFS transporter n=1 Tax=Pseudoclavibacter sp. 8L TaxID=2653162 RepID=UPI0012EFF3E4|nr:MFS transporter [Pseudoclavibacter sp. 8L]VXC41583.1 MFS transporter [Pseudoclavibacter sp. 8L]
MSLLLNWASPKPLGTPFRYLLSSSLFSNLADGILIAAGPLLVASLTQDPLLVSLALVVQQLPWLVFGLFAGVVADRLPRVAIIVTGALSRVLMLAVIGALVLTDTVNLPILYIALFLVGSAEVFTDNAWTSIVPDLVPSKELGIANSRLIASQTVMNQLAGPAIGGAIFAVGHAIPYGVTVVSLLFAVVLVSRITSPPVSTATTGPIETVRSVARVRRDIARGFAWLWQNPPVRTLAIILFAFNITYGMTYGVLVLYAKQRLGLDDAGYGLLLAVSALGGLVGTALYGRLERRFSYTSLMRTCLALETVLHLVLAATANVIVAGLTMFVFGMYTVIWATLASTIRGRAVPSRMRGRVSSVYFLGMIGGMAVGTFVGGLIGQGFGIVTTIWVAFGASILILALVWRSLVHVGRAGEVRADGEAAGSPAAS